MSVITASGTDYHDLSTSLVEVGRQAFAQGWVPATSGNFSARVDDTAIAITVSGTHKGHLNPTDIMLVDSDGASMDGRRPSAETLLHTWIYQWRNDINAVLHTHSVGSTVLSRISNDKVIIDDFEVLKAFEGIATHNTQIVIPVFPNDQDIERLANLAGKYLLDHPAVPGYLICGHGLYTWGDSIATALRHLEAFEFIFDCMLTMRGMNQT